MSERTRDWTINGLSFGDKKSSILICAMLDNVPYFPGDAPVPLVGLDDPIQPEYAIILVTPQAEGMSKFEHLASFFGLDETNTFLRVLASFVEDIVDGAQVEGVWRRLEDKEWVATDVGIMRKTEDGVYLPFDDELEVRVYQRDINVPPPDYMKPQEES